MAREDRRAEAILIRRYWGPGGWHSEKGITAAEAEYARDAGYLLDPITSDHDAMVAGCRAAAAAIRPKLVANAFVCSFRSRNLAARSALASYAVARHLTAHRLEPANLNDRLCRTCAVYPGHQSLDLSVYNFERHKWAGVRRLDLGYIWFDLTMFEQMAPLEPNRADEELVREMLGRIAAAPERTTGSQAGQLLAGLFPANKSERDVVIQCLACIGVLEDPNHPGFRDKFVPYWGRDLPPQRFVDLDYPAVWWRGSHGVDWRAALAWFPFVRAPR